LEPVLKADLLDLDVHSQEIGLLSQWHHLMTGVIEREAQEAAQAGDHLVCGLRLRVNQFGNRIQGVEQKVRLQLHLQYLQMGLRESCLKLGCMQVAGAVESEVSRRRAQGDNGQIGE
jgi:hypothetical protein